MKKQEDLLNKYFRGETTFEEEKALKIQVLNEKVESAEKDIFQYFQAASFVPEDLEKRTLLKIKEKQRQQKSFKVRLIGLSSAAAVLIFFFTAYLDIRKTKNAKLENDFFVMEQALFQISESIQPEEQDEMFILWVDNDVEIIIN